MTPQDLSSTARRRRALESEQGPSVGFQVLAVLGLLVVLVCAGVAVHSVTHWLIGSGQ